MDRSEIVPAQLAIFRRCTFRQRVFASRPLLWAKQPLRNDDLPPVSRDETEWHVSKPYHGEPFDPDEWELHEGGWDHEHCDVCHFKIVDGVTYWPNVDPDAGHVDLCVTCYPRVLSLLGDAPDAESATVPNPAS